MKAFLLFLLCAVSAVSAFAESDDMDEVAIVESSKTFSLLLPAVALPYTLAVIAVVVPLVKAVVVSALKLVNLPLEALLTLYFLVYVALFTFPQLASLLKVTSAFTARSDPAMASGRAQSPIGEAMDWMKNFVPESWMAALSGLSAFTTTSEVTATSESLTEDISTTTESMSTLATSEATVPSTTTKPPTTRPPTTKMVRHPPTSSEASFASEKLVAASGVTRSAARCSSFKVCQSVSRLVKDYPMSIMLMSYLG
ncbi:hypothetical protein V5799_006369 [Amblyomma americanum]|uniref:Secreted protein n=1 Tax=Amblyomma americanum TaxID=6943 RepID=A0AAQ4DWL2_AMBAM